MITACIVSTGRHRTHIVQLCTAICLARNNVWNGIASVVVQKYFTAKIATYIWHPILHRPITIWMGMIHGAQRILSFHRDALVLPEFVPSMWPTTFDYYLFHVYLFEYGAVVILDRLVAFGLVSCGFRIVYNDDNGMGKYGAHSMFTKCK